MEFLQEFFEWAKEHKMEHLPEVVALKRRLIATLEELPIVPYPEVKFPQGFILVAMKWHPVNVLKESLDGWASWQTDDASGVSRPFTWAFADASYSPNMNLTGDASD